MKLINDPDLMRVGAVLAVAGLVLFGASFNDPFHFDDVVITKDSNVTTSSQWFHFFNPLHLRQLTFFTFYLNYLAGGGSPAGFHVVNVLLHIANAVLLFYLLRKFVERWTAIVAAAFFLAHPIQTEPALYVYQRSIVLACFFSLLALLAVSSKRYALAAVLFFCAFQSKESALAVPLALVILYNRRQAKGEMAPELPLRYRGAVLACIFLLGIASLALLSYWGEGTVGIGAMSHTSPLGYFLSQTRVVYTYLRLLVFPYPQSLEYEVSPGVPALQIFGIVAMLAISWFALRRDSWRTYGICAFAFFILLAPTSSIIPSSDVAFEHRLYLPMLAFSLFSASLLAMAPYRAAVTGVVLSVFCMLTIQRGSVWSSEVTLWEDTTQKAPGKARSWFNLGGAHLNIDNEKAGAAFKRAIELQRNFPEAFYNLGIIEQGKGNAIAALGYYDRAVRQNPDYWPAWNNLGNMMFSMGQRERAVEYFERVLSLNPDYWPAQYNLAIVHFSNGRFEKALPKLKTVLDWRPDFREARYLFAVSLRNAGYRNAADEEWKKLGESGVAQANLPAMLPSPSRP